MDGRDKAEILFFVAVISAVSSMWPDITLLACGAFAFGYVSWWLAKPFIYEDDDWPT
jgi:uncharacterized membrane protein YdjX (TVP38/TMEM64 family)